MLEIFQIPTPPPPPIVNPEVILHTYFFPGSNYALRLPFDPNAIQIQAMPSTIVLPDISLSVDIAFWLINSLFPLLITPIGFVIGFMLLAAVVGFVRSQTGAMASNIYVSSQKASAEGWKQWEQEGKELDRQERMIERWRQRRD